MNGTVRFSFPVVIAGREVQDVRLRFEAGKVVEASAAQNEAFLLEQLDTDPGARYLGEFAFGTNFGITEFSKSILFDEKIGGTVHMALGAGYPQTGSRNQSASTGTSSATCAAAGRWTWTASRSCAKGRLWSSGAAEGRRERRSSANPSIR